MTHDHKRARLETLLRENDLSLARVSVAIGRNKTYLQRYLRRGMRAVLAFQDTETLGRLLGCDPSELRHETRPAHAPQPRTRRHPPRRSSLVAIPEITVNARANADTIAEAYAAQPSAPWRLPEPFLLYEGDADTAGVRILKAERNAMAPELQRGDRIVVDTSRHWPTFGELFVLWDGNSIVIKRYERSGIPSHPRSGSTPPTASTRPTSVSHPRPVSWARCCWPYAQRQPPTQPVLLAASAHRRGTPKRVPIPQALPRIDIEHRLPEDERTCPHHAVELERFAELVPFRLGPPCLLSIHTGRLRTRQGTPFRSRDSCTEGKMDTIARTRSASYHWKCEGIAVNHD